MKTKTTLLAIGFFSSLLPISLIINGKTAETKEIVFFIALTAITILSLKSTLKTLKKHK